VLASPGALNAVFLPQLVAAMRRDPDGGTAYVNRLLMLVFCALLAVTVLATEAAPWIVALPARHLDGVHRALAVSFARYCMPQIFFDGVGAGPEQRRRGGGLRRVRRGRRGRRSGQ
jgi:putative peptidoglycan lipid II flippase